MTNIAESQCVFTGLFSKGKSHSKSNLDFICSSNFLHTVKLKLPSKASSFFRSIDDSDTESSRESEDDFHDEDIEQYEAFEVGANNEEGVIGNNDPGNDEGQHPDLGYESATEMQCLQAEQDALRELFDEDTSEDEAFA